MEDKYLWLENIDSDRALSWVRHQNQATLAELQTSPVYSEIEQDACKILLANDRVALGSYAYGYVWNFWQDEAHKHGILRRMTWNQYRAKSSQWEVVMDLDAIAAAENENWVYDSLVRFGPKSERVLLRLSRGGKDASVLREYDLSTRDFVKGGLYVPEAKSTFVPLNENEFMIASDFGAGSLTDAGYPRTVKYWRRGQSLSEAQLVFEVERQDVRANVFSVKSLTSKLLIVERSMDFFNSKFFWVKEDLSLVELPLPTTASIVGWDGQWLYIILKDQVTEHGRTIPANSVVRFEINQLKPIHYDVIFTADQRQSLEAVQLRGQEVYVNLLENVVSRIVKVARSEANVWQATRLDLPDQGEMSLAFGPADDPNFIFMFYYESFLKPVTQYWVSQAGTHLSFEELRSGVERFDSSQFEVTQNFAPSRDGTRIPYFVIRDKNLKFDSANPTLLYGYGGFEISLAPSYLGLDGKLWLERGGVYVVANIRGGNEFGPEWHRAALKENRQKAYDDFIAVAEDLAYRKITSPRHLAIEGGSNGGLLVGAVMIQRPDLFRAVLSHVPLLDMLRFHKLLAGASWMGEYGNPDHPTECQYLLRYSPYQNLKPNASYPRAFFTTSTRDDRVHPAHARKMVARMQEQGHSVQYYENINGGHAGSANLEEKIKMKALAATFLWNSLR